MIDTAMKRFSMLNMASGPVFPRLFEPDGAVDADDRAFLLGLYGGNAFDAPVVITLVANIFINVPSRITSLVMSGVRSLVMPPRITSVKVE